MSVKEETSIIVNANAIRKDGDHTVTVSPGMGGGICLVLSPQVVAGIRAQDGGEGVAWFIDRAASSRLWSAIIEHMGE